MTETTTDQGAAPGSAAGAGAKPTAAQAVKQLLESVRSLGQRVRALEDSNAVLRQENAELAQQLAAQASDVDNLQAVQFMALALHIDLVAAKLKHPDPEVAAEARTHTNMAMQGQAITRPALYEEGYGISATTGEVLPGRVPGQPLNG